MSLDPCIVKIVFIFQAFRCFYNTGISWLKAWNHYHDNNINILIFLTASFKHMWSSSSNTKGHLTSNQLPGMSWYDNIFKLCGYVRGGGGGGCLGRKTNTSGILKILLGNRRPGKISGRHEVIKLKKKNLRFFENVSQKFGTIIPILGGISIYVWRYSNSVRAVPCVFNLSCC